ncbi:MAG TPA: hypothetical protein VFC00_00420 [Micromonosporaceae bacterium]|nr:hypothetical protein [Micromonosporaceae bacterium]
MAEKVIYASAARTATPTAVVVNVGRAKELRLVMDITAVTATPALTITVDGIDSTSGKFFNIITSAALATVATTVLTVALGVTVAANVAVSAPLPQTVRITVTHGDADSATYSLTAHTR